MNNYLMIKEMQTLKRKCLRAFVRFKQSAFARKGTLALVALTLAAGDAMAGSKGAAGFTKATQEVSSYQTPVSNLMKAIAAVIVLVGAFNVYFKMQNGDQGRQEDHHADHRRLYRVHRIVRGFATLLHVNHGRE